MVNVINWFKLNVHANLNLLLNYIESKFKQITPEIIAQQLNEQFKSWTTTVTSILLKADKNCALL